jgi:hypothetical protein
VITAEARNSRSPWRLRLFRRKDYRCANLEGINTVPNGVMNYLRCTLFGHDMEPYNYDVAEPSGVQ